MKKLLAMAAILTFTFGMACDGKKDCCKAGKNKKECTVKDKKACSTKDKKACDKEKKASSDDKGKKAA